MNDKAGFWQRFQRRYAYGLLTQEFLDRIAKLGLTFYPYYVVREQPDRRPDIEAACENWVARYLEQSELVLVSQFPERPRDLRRIQRRLDYGQCFGVWVGDELAAYSWYSHKHLPAVIGGHHMCELPADTLYLYDAFVRPAFRGKKLAVFMRHKLHEALAATGARDCVSISLAFNRSTRRFKAHLGAVETECRLLAYFGRFGGCDCRLRRFCDFLDTPAFIAFGRDREQRA